MDSGKSADEYQFPQLTKFNALKFSAELLVPGNGRKLESRFVETVEFLLESAPSNISETLQPNERVRAVVTLGLEAQWRDKETESEVASFNGKYRAVFNFATEIDESKLVRQMSNQSFRDFLAVQVYPLAKSHMFSQVGMLGINVNRRIGMDIYADRNLVVEVPKKKRTAKKKNET